MTTRAPAVLKTICYQQGEVLYILYIHYSCPQCEILPQCIFVHHTLQLVDEGNANDTEQYIRFVKNKIKAENTPTQHVSLVYCKAVRGVLLYLRMQHM